MRIVKDYISHPTGIRRALETAKDFQPRNLVAVFKPYRYTMIHYLQDEYATAFESADRVVITRMWDAGEDPIEGINTEFLVKKIGTVNEHVDYVPQIGDVPDFLMRFIGPGDMVMFLGGPDMFEQADRVIERLNKAAG